MGQSTTALFYSFIPVATALAGILLVFLKRPSAAVRSAFQHFAAGVVFSVVAIELLPDIRKQQHPFQVAVGFALGIAIMLILRFATAKLKKENDTEQDLPLPLLVATGLDVLIDGILVGIGLNLGQKQGLLLTIALSTEFLSLGLAIALELLERGLNRPKVFSIVLGTCAFVVVGALLGSTILAHVQTGVMQAILSAGLAALLYLVTEELLVEAHEVKETPWITASFFLGFIVFLVLGMTEGS